jgi:hypothetical protein
MEIGGNARLQRTLSSMLPTADHAAEGPSRLFGLNGVSPLGLSLRMGYCP